MFSKATEYALRAVIFIAQKSASEKKIGLAEIARGIDSPKPFTAKILQKLTVNNKIVSSSRGPNGGFYLPEAARKLPVKAVLMAMKEDSVLDKCVLGLKQCSEKQPCPMHAKYKSIKQQLIKMFDTRTIGELAGDLAGGGIVLKNKG